MATATKTRYFATRAFRYNDYLLEPGELFNPMGAKNDAALIGVGYLKEVKEAYPSGYEEAECVRCSRRFVDSSFKAVHDANCPPQTLEASSLLQDIELPGERTDEV